MSEDFLRRWARRKTASRTEVAAEAAKPAAADAAPELPALDSLTFESDFRAFMHSKVEESVKRAALKKLFADPRFNVMDGLDTYIDDYNKVEPVTDELLATLEHARTTLFVPQKEAEVPEQYRAEEEPKNVNDEPKKERDGDRTQDA